MSNAIWAINSNGELTICKAKEENIGKGRCNHLMHAKEGESGAELFLRYKECSDILPLVTDEFREYDYVKVSGFIDEFPPLLRKPKGDPLITNAEAYNRVTGKWERNPDKWHYVVDMNEMSFNEITPEEAMKSSLNIDNKTVEFCEKISEMSHEGQFTKVGEPYCSHPKAVADKCSSPLTKSIAYLHDVVEDTNLNEEKLEAMGVPRVIIDRVLLLTHKKNTPYIDYVGEIARDPIASEVKYCDLKHNTDLSRTGGKMVVPKKKWDNYQKAMKLLNDKYHFE